MKSIIFAAALLTAGVAMAQDTQAPGNASPERDARGIPVVSDPATTPAGANQAAPTGPATPAPNQAAAFAPQPAAGEAPPCSRTVTDHCTQTYEGGATRHRRR
jgi:hypothetical protein